jgi:hypothetical protein
VIGADRLATLERFLPDFVWPYRERFFYEGMRLEVGPCFRDYSAPDFFQAATRRHAGEAHLLPDGGIEGWSAGLPFPPERIEAADQEAGRKWLWNVAARYQAAGFRGRFRMTDLVGRTGRAEPFEGEIFKIVLAHRADRPAPEYVAPDAGNRQWVAGGLFAKPFDAREYAWRQFRSRDNERSAERSDDLHAYLPQWRRVRRLAANQVEGLYMPVFSVGVQPSTQIVVGTGEAGATGGVAGAGGPAGAGGSVASKRSGWEGLEIRPILYGSRVLGVHDVLTPINAVSPGFPEQPEREFGPWGLSFASDRWELRRALVLEAKASRDWGSEVAPRMILYVDLQTLHPLYVATYDRRDELTNVGLYAGRCSEDRPDYPRWPDDPARAVRVIDSVGAAFANLAEAGSWRRESWDVVATPPPDKTLRRLLSVNELTKRR